MWRPRMSSLAGLPQTNHRLVPVGVAGALACQIFLLVMIGRNNRFWINPDGLSYLLLAYHYVKGQFGLAVSGSWGPMISWMMVPALGLGFDPLIAARIVMGLSAFVFL